jgi:YHS domain-containing protein
MMSCLHSESLRRFLVIALWCGFLAGRPASAETSPVTPVNTAEGLAVKGYDPVAYFTVGQPTSGKDSYMYRWNGATYLFASAENLERFKTDPERYLPQYGGYCAYAMSINRIADIDPARWAIVEGKLYLNSNRFSYALWALNKSDNIAAADRNWAVFPKKPQSASASEIPR